VTQVHEAEPGLRRAGGWRSAASVVGELLVTCGLVVLLFVVYELFVTDLIAERHQDELSEQLEAEWDDAGPAAVARPEVPGDALAVLYIPRLGVDYRRVVLEGTAEETLSQGPGHYSDTALPGEPGNFSLAGHRVGKGSPFLALDELRPGDPIVVETATSWFVYRVLGDRETGEFDGDPSGIPGRQIVRPTDIEVISPTPDGPARGAPTGTYLTLTTCHPRYSAEQRLIIHATLDGAAIAKADVPDGPSALRER
jgi:sortase (surface protein transpeptidase)